MICNYNKIITLINDNYYLIISNGRQKIRIKDKRAKN